MKRVFTVAAMPFMLAFAASAAETSCHDILRSKPVTISYRKIYEIANERKLSKDEFESTASYNARRVKALGEATDDVKRISGADHIVFSAPATETAEVKYDSDKNIMVVSNRYSGIVSTLNALDDTDHKMYITYIDPPLESAIRSIKGTYVGKNSFGATTSVSVEENDIFVIGINKKKTFNYYWPKEDVRYTFKMAPDTARKMNGKIDVLFVGTLVPPYIVKSVAYHKPTIDNPIDGTNLRRGAVVAVQCAALVNRNNGDYLVTIYGGEAGAE